MMWTTLSRQTSTSHLLNGLGERLRRLEQQCVSGGGGLSSVLPPGPPTGEDCDFLRQLLHRCDAGQIDAKVAE